MDCISIDGHRIEVRQTKFMWPTWGPPGSCQSQMGPMLAPWTLLSGYISAVRCLKAMVIFSKACMVFNKTALYHFVTHWYCLMSVTVFMYGVKHMTHLNLSCCMGHCWTTAHTNVHDDVIKWKHFLHYWPFVLGIHRSPMNSLHKGQWRRALMFSLIYA